MKRFLLIVGWIFLLPATGLWADSACGDEGLQCIEGERCCEHVVAMYAESAYSPHSYVKGRCIPEEKKCADFWCGNRQCKAGLFGTPSVCCLYKPVDGEPKYSCAYSELHCPGNSKQVSIRETAPKKNIGE